MKNHATKYRPIVFVEDSSHFKMALLLIDGISQGTTHLSLVNHLIGDVW